MAGGQKSIVLNIADNLAKAADLRGFVSEFIQSMGIQGGDKSSCTRETTPNGFLTISKGCLNQPTAIFLHMTVL
jgi:hypothetical protein